MSSTTVLIDATKTSSRRIAKHRASLVSRFRSLIDGWGMIEQYSNHQRDA
jgi:hypothetical protein